MQHEVLKALSVRQPWAELILSGEKTVEIRSQITKIRGRVYSYAALGKPDETIDENLSIVALAWEETSLRDIFYLFWDNLGYKYKDAQWVKDRDMRSKLVATFFPKLFFTNCSCIAADRVCSADRLALFYVSRFSKVFFRENDRLTQEWNRVKECVGIPTVNPTIQNDQEKPPLTTPS